MRSVVFSRKGFHVKSVFLFIVWSNLCYAVLQQVVSEPKVSAIRCSGRLSAALPEQHCAAFVWINSRSFVTSCRFAKFKHPRIEIQDTESFVGASVRRFCDPSIAVGFSASRRCDRRGQDRQPSPAALLSCAIPYGTFFDPPLYPNPLVSIKSVRGGLCGSIREVPDRSVEAAAVYPRSDLRSRRR